VSPAEPTLPALATLPPALPVFSSPPTIPDGCTGGSDEPQADGIISATKISVVFRMHHDDAMALGARLFGSVRLSVCAGVVGPIVRDLRT
jgi:hypothetical protein